MKNIKLLWFDKKYHSYNYYLKNKFKQKIIKIPVNCNFSCPNRDGVKSIKGCAFCSAKSFNSIYENIDDNIQMQFENVKSQLSNKWPVAKYIIYFQSFSGTYQEIEYLRAKYFEAINIKDVVGIAIATRPDCITSEVIELLSELSEKTYVSVELGLQTSYEPSHILMNSCFTNEDYVNAMLMLNTANINTVTHIILGLPFENKQIMLETAKFVIDNKSSGVKLQLLHVLKDTELAKMYNDNDFEVLKKDTYIDIIVSILEILPPEMVIHRLTGDGQKSELIAPLYSLSKRDILNSIDKELVKRNTFQGRLFV